MSWIVVNIGCIECDVSSAIVGVFSNETEANAVAERLIDTHSWREGGQNSFEVFQMPPLDEVAAEYAAPANLKQGSQDSDLLKVRATFAQESGVSRNNDGGDNG